MFIHGNAPSALSTHLSRICGTLDARILFLLLFLRLTLLPKMFHAPLASALYRRLQSRQMNKPCLIRFVFVEPHLWQVTLVLYSWTNCTSIPAFCRRSSRRSFSSPLG